MAVRPTAQGPRPRRRRTRTTSSSAVASSSWLAHTVEFSQGPGPRASGLTMNESKASRYQRYRRRAESAGVVSGAAMLALVALTPLSRWLATGASGFGLGLPEAPREALALVIFVILVVVAWELAALPAMLYLGLRVDRRFANPSIAVEDVLAAQAHAALVALPAALVAGAALTLSVWVAGAWWWVMAGALLAGALVAALHGLPRLLARLAEVRPIARPDLAARLNALAVQANVPVTGIEEMQLDEAERTTAIVAGAGRSRRIFVSSGLLRDWSDDEIAVIVAHELAHHAHRDLWRTLVVDASVLAIALFVADRALADVAPALGLAGPGDVAALPFLTLVAGSGLAGPDAAAARALAAAGTARRRVRARAHRRRRRVFARRSAGSASAISSRIGRRSSRAGCFTVIRRVERAAGAGGGVSEDLGSRFTMNRKTRTRGLTCLRRRACPSSSGRTARRSSGCSRSRTRRPGRRGTRTTPACPARRAADAVVRSDREAVGDVFRGKRDADEVVLLHADLAAVRGGYLRAVTEMSRRFCATSTIAPSTTNVSARPITKTRAEQTAGRTNRHADLHFIRRVCRSIGRGGGGKHRGSKAQGPKARRRSLGSPAFKLSGFQALSISVFGAAGRGRRRDLGHVRRRHRVAPVIFAGVHGAVGHGPRIARRRAFVGRRAAPCG